MSWVAVVFACWIGVAASESPDPIDGREVGPDHPLAESYVPAPLVELAVPPATREGLRLRPEARAALETMLAQAHADGIELRVVSAYRSFGYQQSVHARAVQRHGADQQWVAKPGESEHQLGTTVDLADAALKHVLVQEFGEIEAGRWVAENCHRFGFRLTYTPATAESLGIRPEPWHVRYLGSLDREDR